MFTYEINIAIHSKTLGCAMHWGKIALNAGITESSAKVDFQIACDKFPASEGWSLTLQKTPAKSYETIAYSEGA